MSVSVERYIMDEEEEEEDDNGLETVEKSPSHIFNDDDVLSPSPLTIENRNTLVQNFLASNAVFPDAPWWSVLLVNQNATRGAHTIIETSQWPPQTTNNYNYNGRRRVTVVSSHVVTEHPGTELQLHSNQLEHNEHKRTRPSEWLLAQIVGPLSKKSHAAILNRLWEDRSRGAIPRAAKAKVLAEHFKLEVYGDLSVIFGDTPENVEEATGGGSASSSPRPREG